MRKQPDETAEIERVLIACALQDVEIAGRLTARVEPVMFAAPNRGRCWSTLAHVVANGPGRLAMIDAVAAELDRQSDASALAALHDLTDLVPAVGNKNADYFAERVADVPTSAESGAGGYARRRSSTPSRSWRCCCWRSRRGGIRTCAPCSASPSP